jgi:hypothetical protein
VGKFIEGLGKVLVGLRRGVSLEHMAKRLAHVVTVAHDDGGVRGWLTFGHFSQSGIDFFKTAA